MIAIYITLAACAALLLGALGFLALIAVGVRTGDRGDLTAPPRNRIDAITRRVVGGYRGNSRNRKW
jgi:hypothetical protein